MTCDASADTFDSDTNEFIIKQFLASCLPAAVVDARAHDFDTLDVGEPPVDVATHAVYTAFANDKCSPASCALCMNLHDCDTLDVCEPPVDVVTHVVYIALANDKCIPASCALP